MKIRAIAHALPSRLVTNQDWIDEILAASRESLAPAELAELETGLVGLYEKVGAISRYHRADGERAIDFGLAAARQALDRAGLSPKEIDLLIHVGVGRGFLEPATANVFQSTLGLVNATCFDLLDACASWLRGLDVAWHMLSSDPYRNAMILNCEFNVSEYFSPVIESLGEFKQMESSVTIGEAATATIVSRGSRKRDYFASFRSFGGASGLCQIPLPHANQFSMNGDQPRSMRFLANALALNGAVIRQLERHYWSEERLWKQEYDVSFGHSAGLPATRRVANKLQLDPDKHYEIFPIYGNTVSASLPLAMSLAFAEERLKRHHRVLLIMGSAGVTTAFCRFEF